MKAWVLLMAVAAQIQPSEPPFLYEEPAMAFAEKGLRQLLEKTEFRYVPGSLLFKSPEGMRRALEKKVSPAIRRDTYFLAVRRGDEEVCYEGEISLIVFDLVMWSWRNAVPGSLMYIEPGDSSVSKKWRFYVAANWPVPGTKRTVELHLAHPEAFSRWRTSYPIDVRRIAKELRFRQERTAECRLAESH
jgi:hypothetical protein